MLFVIFMTSIDMRSRDKGNVALGDLPDQSTAICRCLLRNMWLESIFILTISYIRVRHLHSH